MSHSIKTILSKKILVVCLIAGLIIAAILSTGAWLMEKMYQNEKTLVIRDAGVNVEDFTQHTVMIINQADTLLHGVRMFYLRTGSLSQTDQYIDGLPFDKAIIENIYLVNSDGEITISHNLNAKQVNVSDRDYFLFHQSTLGDSIFISPVELDRVTGKYLLRISRRINNRDGSFGGVVFAMIVPQSFSSYFQGIRIGSENVATLLGTLDHKMRARFPEPAVDTWALPVVSPLWDALANAQTGSYENTSATENIHRVFVYEKIADLPLVMLVEFSETDITDLLVEQKSGLTLGESTVIVFILIITIVLIGLLVSLDKLESAYRSLNEVNSVHQKMVLFDRLTDLPSRVLFSDRFQYALYSAERNSEKCTLLFVDLDNFKAVNDNFGHDVGDRLLKILSARMKQVVRNADTICRWGGDEFLILLSRSNGNGDIAEVTQRLMAAIREPSEFNGMTCAVSASIGIASFPQDGQTPAEIQKAADDAMYEAKKQGKDRMVFASKPG